MSAVNLNSADQLPAEILWMIFNQLDAATLATCEAVCKRWRHIATSGLPWKNVFLKQMKSSRLWRKMWQNLQLDAANSAADFKSICRTGFNRMRELEQNWRNGNFVEKSLLVDGDVMMCDDYIAVECNSTDALEFFSRDSMRLERVIPRYLSAMNRIAVIDKDLVIANSFVQLIFIDAVTGQPRKTLEIPTGWYCTGCTFQDNILVDFRRNVGGDLCRFVTWKLCPISLEMSPVAKWTFRGAGKCQMNDRYICATIRRSGKLSCYCFSKETLEMETSLSFRSQVVSYSQGVYLIRRSEDRMRLLDAASGTFICDLDTSGLGFEWVALRAFVMSSKYFVMLQSASSLSKIYIYDLHLLKNANSSSPLLKTIKCNVGVYRIWMDESKLFCLTLGAKLRVLDFGCFNGDE